MRVLVITVLAGMLMIMGTLFSDMGMRVGMFVRMPVGMPMPVRV